MKSNLFFPIALALALGAVVVLGAFFVISYNGLIQKDETVKQAWSDIDAQLQRRAELIPNLVSTVKGYAAHEEKIFTQVAQARENLVKATTPTDKAAADAELKTAVGRLLAIAESYPELKAADAFVRLQDELAGTENRIAVARTRYNEAVKVYNAAIRGIPGSFYAKSLKLEPAAFYEVPAGRDSVEKVPEVQF